jgi:hypothetical protein
VRLGLDLRVYAEVRGLSEAAWRRLAPECPFAAASYADGRLAIEHEGRWVDGEAFWDALVAALEPGGEGHLDLIDNEAWTITRCTLGPGKRDCQTFGLDDVLENTKGEGNI